MALHVGSHMCSSVNYIHTKAGGMVSATQKPRCMNDTLTRTTLTLLDSHDGVTSAGVLGVLLLRSSGSMRGEIIGETVGLLTTLLFHLPAAEMLGRGFTAGFNKPAW